ncbi:MAG: ribosome-binding factor A [Firmicutes bacterium]|nr:ribosome-binding factor A [Bacillota bacterium]MCL2771481.1 ribosome-binding factor A [Bacillota bacterium]
MTEQNKAIGRANSEYGKAISAAIKNFTSDRFKKDAIVTVTKVECAPDLRSAKVNLSVFVIGATFTQKEVFDGVVAASGAIRSFVARKVNKKVTPAFTYVLDGTEDRVQRIEETIKQIKK